MADSTKEIKDAIWRKKQEIQKEQGQREEWASMVPAIEVSLTTFKEGSAEYIEWSSSLADAKTAITAHDATLAKLNEELAELEARLPKAPEQAAPKFDREKHPAFQRKAAEKQEPEQAVNFSIGEIVEAQWTDRAWYKAKIQSVLGSVSAPKYLVRFIEYDDTMTVDRSAVRPIQRKRKHDEPATAPAPAMPAATGPHVISGPASINPNAQLVIKKAAGEDEDQEPKKKSRIANKKQLKERQSNWQQFQAKTAKKIPQKDSMFRTSTQAGSRVGFTGSGKGMTETRSRTRYDHKADAEKDEEYQEALHYRDSTSRDRRY